MPENYRPISLLPIGYKVLAGILQKRIQNGGAENRIRNTQFGFRPGRNTVHALSIARRMIDAAYASQEPSLIAVLLDWAKAFDRIRVDSMMTALRRFGFLTEILDMIAAIYKTRYFILRDDGGNSSTRLQAAGIAQGYPLSPYLFILVQTILLYDVDQRMLLESFAVDEPEYIVCNDVLYADDTFLVSSSATKLQDHLNIIVDEGKRYGLELNWGKTFMMKIKNQGQILQPNGQPLKIVN